VAKTIVKYHEFGRSIAETWGYSIEDTPGSRHEHTQKLTDEQRAICLLAHLCMQTSDLINELSAQRSDNRRLRHDLTKALKRITELESQARSRFVGGKATDPHGLEGVTE
jgi:hypothetical protein